MRIAIVNVTGGGLSGGYKKYLMNLVPRLVAHPEVDALLCAAPDSVGMRDLIPSHPKITFVSSKPYRFVHNFVLSRPDRELLDGINAFFPDVVFIPADRYLRFGPLPVVNMIRNMEPFINNFMRDPATERVKKAIQSIDARRSARHSDRVIAVSDFVRQTVVVNWKIDPSRVERVYHGINLPQVDEIVERPSSIPDASEREFLFTCGSIRPARGLEDAVEALAHCADRKKRHRLIIAGATAPSMVPYRAILEQQLVKNGCAPQVTWVGNLDEKGMKWCYKNCFLFIMTSRIEACPNIALEAMANGCLIISADTPPMPEFFGDSALYYTPCDSRSLSKVIEDARCLDSATKLSMRDKALKRALTFSWDRTAAETMAVLKKVVRAYTHKTHLMD